MNASLALEAEEQAPAAPRLARWTAAAGLLALLSLALVLLLKSGEGKVSSLLISGDLQRVRPAQIEQALRPLLDSGLLSLELEPLRAAVERIPWVAHARVERAWPAGLRIHVWERSAFAQWGAVGAKTALDVEARVFQPEAGELPEGLPRLQAPPGQEQAVMLMYQRLHQALAGGPFAIGALELDARGEWLARTATGLELRLGREDPVAKTDLLRSQVTRALSARLAEVQYLDLRYMNGFAVGWKAPQEPAGESDG